MSQSVEHPTLDLSSGLDLRYLSFKKNLFRLTAYIFLEEVLIFMYKLH